MTEKAKRPKQLPGITERFSTGCGNIYVTITVQDGKPFEVFGTLGKEGNCPGCFLEALSRSITLGLRSGVPAEEYAKTLSGIRCPSPGLEDGISILSCPDAISRALRGVK